MKGICINLHQDSFPHLDKSERATMMKEFASVRTPEGRYSIKYFFEADNSVPRLTVTGFDNNEAVTQAVVAGWLDMLVALPPRRNIFSALTITCSSCGKINPSHRFHCSRCSIILKEASDD